MVRAAKIDSEDRAERKRRLARERQARCRDRRRRGDRLLLVPAEIADELGDEDMAERAIEILRRFTERDIA